MPSLLFSPYRLREIDFRNRIFVPPMCQYSATDGVPGPWHMVHYGSFARGGAALVIVEATAVSPEGRISPFDCGLWNQAQVEAFQSITAFVREQGAVPGVQLAHAGRKASTDAPWNGGGPLSPPSSSQPSSLGWKPIAPSAISFSDQHPVPHEMSLAEIEALKSDFKTAAERALQAGFQVVEIHAAHGYLLHEFLSPLSNKRQDIYGGSLENRLRLPLEVARVVREAWPSQWPVFVRLSATDWVQGGWDDDESVTFARGLKDLGIDLVDVSTGGLVPDAVIPAGPAFQVPFAEKIRREAQIPTGAVGIITDPQQAESILAQGKADAVLIGRQLLREPHWPLHAAKALGAKIAWPKQYERAAR
jgi:2,4-dienoyl-CoA reductase-like NADH-dependent reductase (Old Yellow Enzyme family)